MRIIVVHHPWIPVEKGNLVSDLQGVSVTVSAVGCLNGRSSLLASCFSDQVKERVSIRPAERSGPESSLQSHREQLLIYSGSLSFHPLLLFITQPISREANYSTLNMSSSGTSINSIKPEDVKAWTLDIEVSLHHQPLFAHWCALRVSDRHVSLRSL